MKEESADHPIAVIVLILILLIQWSTFDFNNFYPGIYKAFNDPVNGEVVYFVVHVTNALRLKKCGG